MGGRGASSSTARQRSSLPGGGAAMTVTFGSGAKNVYKMSESGVLLLASSLEDTFTRANTNFSIRDLYDRAVERGYQVQIHSKKEVDEAVERNHARRAENRRDVAQAEVAGTGQTKRISKHSGRINSSRRRGR